MKQFLALAGLLGYFLTASAQTPEALVHDVLANTVSTSQLKRVLLKNAPFNDGDNCGCSRNARGFLEQKIICSCFNYKTVAGGGDTVYKLVTFQAFYTGEQLGYIRISESFFDLKNNINVDDSILLKYIDTSYTTNLLASYNAKHRTDFNWQQLYEDSLTFYDGLPELLEPLLDPETATEEEAAQGKVRGGLLIGPPYSTSIFRPMLINRDHVSIVKNARSFNPVRKAYGGYCLFVLEQMGEPLTREEKQLYSTISRCTEKIPIYYGCVGRSLPISAIFNKNDLKVFATYFKEFKSKGGQF